MKDELIKNIAGGIDLPKRLFDNAELLLKKLLGSAVEETGSMLGDAIRSRRFKNQVNIFSKAQELLKSKGLEPKQINLKLLVPLIEYSSLEEDETIQNKWANMIANIATNANEDSFNKKCISILDELSIIEVAILDEVYSLVEETVIEVNTKTQTYSPITDEYLNLDNYNFSLSDLKISDTISKIDRKISSERLISLGLFKNVEPEIIPYPDYHPNAVIGLPGYPTHFAQVTNKLRITNFGLYFIKLCKFDK